MKVTSVKMNFHQPMTQLEKIIGKNFSKFEEKKNFLITAFCGRKIEIKNHHHVHLK